MVASKDESVVSEQVVFLLSYMPDVAAYEERTDTDI